VSRRDPHAPLEAHAKCAAGNGGVAGCALASDEKRVLTTWLTHERRGPNRIRYEVHLHSNGSDTQTRVCFDVDSPFPLELPERADAALLVALFPALHHGGSLRVKGVVSPLLLRNLLDLQGIWIRARPDRYRPFRVETEGVCDAVPAGAQRKAVLPLSGGLDSLLALCRHTDPRRPLGDATTELGACLFLPGFSPREDRKAEYPAAIAKVRRIAARRGLPLVVAETNFPRVVRWIKDSHGALLAGAMTLLSPHFRGGLIGGSVPHVLPEFPVWGSAAQIDPFFSSDGFEIRDDGGDLLRELKSAAILHYPDMLDELMVCFKVPGMAANCCRCEKCTRTMLSLLAAGGEIPPRAFPEGLDLERVGVGIRGKMGYVAPTLRLAGSRRVTHPAFRLLRRRYAVHRAGYLLRYAVTRALPWVDLIRKDVHPPPWLLARKARAAQSSSGRLAWRDAEEVERKQKQWARGAR